MRYVRLRRGSSRVHIDPEEDCNIATNAVAAPCASEDMSTEEAEKETRDVLDKEAWRENETESFSLKRKEVDWLSGNEEKGAPPPDVYKSRVSGKSIFHQARNYIESGWFFRTATLISAERKLLVTFMIHFVCTIIIWVHFALIKFEEQTKVPDGANRYWWKRLAPPLEFGSMHAILFQMALLPLTMSRLSIASASLTVLNRYIPFNRMVRFHIHLGYTLISIVFFATVFFFAFFGLLCSDGEEQFCEKFTTEIMITGYCIVGTLLLIGGSSYFRNNIPYEIFYGLHHLVFIFYAITVAHTFDNAQRNHERERSQTFKWYSATLLYYFCDRAAMAMIHRYDTSIVRSTTVTSSKGTRMVILKIHRPTLFQFKPGQYALLRIKDIDMQWHPFSIASGPESDFLEFYIEVYNKKSWTNKLWEMSNNRTEERGEVCFSSKKINIEVKGPYGTSLGKTDDFSHAIAIGSGTGVVPVLSLLKEHVSFILRLDPRTYFDEQELRNKKLQRLHEMHDVNRGSLLNWFLCSFRQREKTQLNVREDEVHALKKSITHSIYDLRNIESERQKRMSLMEIKRESRKARLPIYGGVALLLLPVFGVTMLGLTLSWNHLPIDLYKGMDDVLKYGTLSFHFLFSLVALTVHDRSHFCTLLDVVISVIFCFVSWYWFAKNLWGTFETDDIVYYTILVFYMTVRLWDTAIKSSEKSWRKEASMGFPVALEKLRFIWVTRSAHLVSEIVPDIIHIWDSLCKAWGEDFAGRVCEISIYVTDKDEDACSALTAETSKSSLFRSGCIKFERPDIPGIIESHTLDRLAEDDQSPHSKTLLAFCGSPNLSTDIQRAKIVNDLSIFITNNKLHQMDFVSESYGASKTKQAEIYPVAPRDDAGKPMIARRNSELYRSDLALDELDPYCEETENGQLIYRL